MTPVTKTFQYGEHEVTIKTGQIARQADGAVMVEMAGTAVLVTVVGKRDVAPGQDFFPLTVNYQERSYAAGKIPGGFFKREGRPSEKETLTSRLIDRPIRPLFPEGFLNEVQIIATVMSVNTDLDPDIPAMLGASAALAISGIPFMGPIGAARVGYKDGQFLLNPGFKALESSDLDLVVAGTKNAVLMVESEAKMLPEDVMLDAVMYGHEQMQTAINAINEFVASVDVTPWAWEAPAKDEELAAAVAEAAQAGLSDAYMIPEKMARYERVAQVKADTLAKLCPAGAENPRWDAGDVANAFSSLEKQIVRGRIISGQPRIDGRDTRTVRPISVELGVLPRTHGSALFTRGETQALVVATLGGEKEAQIIDALEGERKENFMLHYNFPPYCVGETGRVGSPGRREIGHGRLAKRGVQAVMPADYPHSVRVVSEITESNGSSSMASVCGSSLAMMDAGIPLIAPVAGVAMGLIKEGDRFAVLTDILGDEDHLGDMDFKVAGSMEGVTALQMDIKIDGITREIMEAALSQAHEGRIHILGEMAKVITEPRQEVSEWAPRSEIIKVKTDKIREIIGKGGSVIKNIVAVSGANVSIDDDGTVTITSVGKDAAEKAKEMIAEITAEVEVGKIYEGPVSRIVDFGAFVTIMPNKDGLVHISQISDERVENVSDYLQEGQVVKVKVLEMDKQGRIRLSIKALNEKAEENQAEVMEEAADVNGNVAD